MIRCQHISEILNDCPLENKGNCHTFNTGFACLDNLIGGFQPGELVTIAGRPCMGKTALCLSLAHKFALTDKIPTAIFCLESNQRTFIHQLMANVAALPCHTLRKNAVLSPEEKEKLEKATKQLATSPLYVNVPPYAGGFCLLTMSELADSIKEVVQKQGVKIVFVIGFQHINADYYMPQSYRRHAFALKKIALEWNVSIVTTSFLNWWIENRDGVEGKYPQLGDLRYVGDLDEISDIVLGVFRPAGYNVNMDIEGNDLTNTLHLSLLKTKAGIDNIVMDLKIDMDTFSVQE